jgi:hypothetical protein
MKGSAMTSFIDSAQTLAHVQGGVMIAVLMFATTAGFLAGMFFERALGRRSRDGE